MRVLQLLCLLALLCEVPVALAQTGKIAGRVTDGQTNEPIPGVNVAIDGTVLGTSTDVDGYYTILNVSPGVYDVRASFIGFAPQVVEQVRVNIDLTSEVDFQLSEEAVGLEEIVVAAERPIVQRDVSANVANLNMSEIENLPVSSIEEVIGMQAGIEPGLSVRGSGASDVAFVIDGMSTRNPRNNNPFTGISYTSIEEVQVQTGGFNAEYGNIRSGLVNVSTKEPSGSRYTADILTRYSAPSRKYFGITPNDPEAYWMRPFLDPDVAYVGTHTDESPWDLYMRRQYPQWQGYNSRATGLTQQGINLSPEQAQEAWEWYHRKDFSPAADFSVDGTIGGPVPGISQPLGNLRFLASYRQEQESYLVPKTRDAYDEQTGQLKLISNLGPGMKLTVNGLYGNQSGMNAGGSSIHTGELPPYPWSARGVIDDLGGSLGTNSLFVNDDWSLTDISNVQLGGHFTHMLNDKTFYDLRLQRNTSKYKTGPGDPRDPTILKTVGDLELDEAPFGYYNQTWLYEPISGTAVGGVWGITRDTTEVVTWNLRADLTNQMNRFTMLKAGADLHFTDYDSRVNYVAPAFSSQEQDLVWHRKALQGAVYAQTKLEFQGLIANVGLRADYFKPSGDWYVYDLYDPALGTNALDELEQRSIDGRFSVSPRLGVSFPVQENSKLYFNYGHFRDIQNIENLYEIGTIQGRSKIERIGNPNLPMQKTIAYELGYDQNLFDLLLLRIAGYYKAQSDQPRDVWFHSFNSRVNYSTSYPFNYGDTRGLEFTLVKNRGRWVHGFVNYTYMVRKSGNFGYGDIYENRAQMRDEIRESTQHYLNRPVPEPFANFNIEVTTPSILGEDNLAGRVLGDWRISFLGEWRAGQVFTWDGNSSIEIVDNVRWKDYYMLDMRLSKAINTTVGEAVFFVDISNVLNLKHLSRVGAFEGSFDFVYYMQSLHLAEDTFDEGFEEPYNFVYGNDKPGDYRKEGVDFVPIEVVTDLPSEGISRTQGHYGPLYYVKDTGEYHVWTNGGWQSADRSKVDQVLEDKAYIDMPNAEYFRFFNPRDIFFGIRLTF